MVGSGLLLAAFTFNASGQAPVAKPTAAQQQKAASDVMKECVARERAKSTVDAEVATATCREQREAERLKETGPHSSSEVTVNSPEAPAGKMSASGHSSHSATTGNEPSTTIQESKNSAPKKPE